MVMETVSLLSTAKSSIAAKEIVFSSSPDSKVIDRIVSEGEVNPSPKVLITKSPESSGLGLGSGSGVAVPPIVK